MKRQYNLRLLSIQILMTLAVLCALATALPAGMEDLYDDVENFFDAVSLDDVAASGRQTKPETFCLMPARKGVCRALIPRWSYDPQKKDCFEFKFGGCDGNENNFPSYKQCMATCGST